MKKFIIIDGNAMLHRAWHAIPQLNTKDGVMVNAAFGFTSMFLKIISELKPDYICSTFDMRAKTFRHEKFENYKAKRIKQPDELYNQIPIIKEILNSFDVPIFEKSGFEADDLIGTIAEKLRGRKDLGVYIVTGDMDCLQLVGENIKVYTFKRGITEAAIYDDAAVYERYSLKPSQMIDYKALRGDASDNIPGIKGIGEKTAIELLKKFKTIDEIYKQIKKSNFSESIKEKIINGKKDAYFSYELATIDRNVNIDFSLEKAKWDFSDEGMVYNTFQKYEFRSLLNKIPKFSKARGGLFEFKEIKNTLNYHLIKTDSDFNLFYKKIYTEDEFALDTETTSFNAMEAKLLGISFCFKSGEAYFLVYKKEYLEKLSKILETKKTIGHNIKYDYQVLKNYGVELKNIYFDTLIAGYLLSKTDRSLKLGDLVFSELGYRMQAIEELIGKKGKDQLNMEDVNIEKISNYSCEDADYTFKLYKKYKKDLESEKLDNLFLKLEMPLVKVLADMELDGIMVDMSYLKKLKKDFQKKLDELTKGIHELAGCEFNINSTQQLKEILFKKLEIPTKGIKSTKTGFSTAAAELEKMKGLHPIIDLISDYREINKLQSTYVNSLIENADKNQRIHTSFNQAVTSTGRLSSSNPNLQNIPIRTELGKKIRKVFIAKQGFSLVSLDYSQIELRIVASLSKDDKMINSFKNGEDIHLRTAAEINNISLDDVSKPQRRMAKEINFGVIYGLGPRGLMQRTDLNMEQAKNFIEKYFTLYKKVKNYLEKIKVFAEKNGYVCTLFGRKRYIPEIHSRAPMIQAMAQRMAINMPIQGTAADLIKMAMIKIANELGTISRDSRMLLQVHDELVLEVPNKDIEKVSKKVQNIMEGIYDFGLPIKVEVSSGRNWGECK
ncbi:MAG TPA: DNA polymerase I [bacterium]|jgi:DNA polymerase-1|nr:DNA polymerase I [bacterium]HOG38403.1 DNA polymerase I [bacterium]HQI03361.1 DNA polymerase I [bacterium]